MRLLLAALLLVHGAAMGQTFACQYTTTVSLTPERSSRWKSAEIPNDAPFFISIINGAIDIEGVRNFVCEA